MAMTPDLIETYGQAVARVQAGAFDEAEVLLRRILVRVPRQGESLHLLGVVEQQRGRFASALDALDLAAQLQPDNVDLALRQGMVAHEAGDHAGSLTAFDRALELAPDLPQALNGRSIALDMLGRHGEARSVMARALALDPGLIVLHDRRLGDRRRVCDWKGLTETETRINAAIDRGEVACHPFELMAMGADPARQQALTRAYAASAHPAQPAVWHGEAYGHDRIRLAFLSADFKDHPVAHQLAGVLEQLDRTKFEVVAVSWGGKTSAHPVRDRISAAVDRFEDVQGMDAAGIANHIRALEIDVAVSLGGYTKNALPDLFAQRCAPLQVNYLGYPGTMGAPYVDYIVADETVIPTDEARLQDEAVVWLPVTYHPTDHRAEVAATPSRTDLGLPSDAFVFCAYSQAWKITPGMFDVWMRILGQVEGSVLWLADPGEFARGNLGGEATARGIDPERLVFAGRTEARADYVARLAAADLMLDTLPYNAHSVASDALWAGLPVLTCSGPGFPGRVGVGLLKAVDLPDLIAPDLAVYEALAVELATSPDRLGALRQKLEITRRTAPLFQTARYAEELGRALETMYRRRADGLAPASFRIALR